MAFWRASVFRHIRLRGTLSPVIRSVPVCSRVVVASTEAVLVRSVLQPAYLLLLAGLPLLIGFSRKSLAGLGPTRQTLAIVLRSVILILVIGALAETQFVRFTERLTVLFAIDYSRSIPQDREVFVRDYVDRLIQKHKQPNERRA